MTSCSASGPGRRWQKLSARTNSSSLSHLLRSTSWRCMRPIWPTGPPNASHPSLRKYQKISDIETCWSSADRASDGFPCSAKRRFPRSVLRRPGVQREEVVEQGGAALEARFVVRVRGGDSGDELADAGRLLTAVLRVLHVDVVDDLGERAQGGVIEPEAQN